MLLIHTDTREKSIYNPGMTVDGGIVLSKVIYGQINFNLYMKGATLNLQIIPIDYKYTEHISPCFI